MMTSRERMMTALNHGTPDRVPCAPDISNMIPCRLTGKPFWDIYINQSPPLWRAYLDAVRYFGIDAWFIYGHIDYKTKSTIVSSKRVEKSERQWLVNEKIQTPDGDLNQTTVYAIDNPPTHTDKIIKDFASDFKKIRHLFSDIVAFDASVLHQQIKELGELGIMSVGLSSPGLHTYTDLFQGSLEAATYAYYDYPELFEELEEMHRKQILQKLDIAISLGVDSVRTGGSGSITLQSPEIWRKLSLPTIKEVTRISKEAGIISGIHSCGKEFYLAEICANETDLDYINPLEIAPMGDCELRTCKELFGHKLSLMGNLHTTDVMLNGSIDIVRRASLQAILDAGIGGAFVLSTGDQCGRDTPEENIFEMVRVCRDYGKYPLDIEAIQSAILS